MSADRIDECEVIDASERIAAAYGRIAHANSMLEHCSDEAMDSWYEIIADAKDVLVSLGEILEAK